MMKHLIFAGLSSALLASVTTPVMASEEVAAVTNYGQQATTTLLATTLVQLAYQGYFSDLGIPSHAGFIHAVAADKIDAETLIKSAIAKGRLNNNALGNEEYVSIVTTELHAVAFP
ncbi:MAG: hypothetical protein QNJ42_22470 [Crocosphaera sp.]|nr:hypothetical protein [Crocosphaera sp.]